MGIFLTRETRALLPLCSKVGWDNHCPHRADRAVRGAYYFKRLTANKPQRAGLIFFFERLSQSCWDLICAVSSLGSSTLNYLQGYEHKCICKASFCAVCVHVFRLGCSCVNSVCRPATIGQKQLPFPNAHGNAVP